MSTFYEMDLRVDSRDVDLFNQCRPSAVLGYLQEASTQAAIALGVSGPQILERYNCLWMVTRSWVELDAPLRWNDPVHIKTWHRGASGVSSYRDFDLFRDGKPVGQGVTQWVMVDADSRQLFRMKDLAEFQGTDGGDLKKSVKLRRVPMPTAFDARVQRDLRYSDTDINGHVNNIHYADFACDSLHLERMGRDRFVRSMQIGYVNECRAGETIWISTAVQGDEWIARGEGADGDERFEFSLTLGDVVPFS
ncbi:MAG: acyl-ACP thioesterase [Oscillospiraceae bacterium]|nr:acyl-ACP thioesterase [Oscillospiraceae bacterium]